MIRVAAATLFLCTIGAVGATTVAASGLPSGYTVTTWVATDTVPLGAVYAIAQAADGHLWIGADAGLLRFDGLRFTRWALGPDMPPLEVPVSALRVANDGSVWVGFADGSGVRRVRDNELTATEQPGPLAGAVTDLIEERNGTLWAISDNRLYRRSGDKWTLLVLPWLGRPSLVLRLGTTQSGDLWVATSHGLFRRTGAASEFERIASGYIWDRSESPDGTSWITDIATGFRRLDDAARSGRAFEGGGYRLMHDANGDLWVGTLGEGLWRVRHSTPAQSSLRINLPSDTVQSLLEDREGNVWVGTTAGLHRLRPRMLRPIQNMGFVISLAPGNDGTIWVGTSDGPARVATEPLKWKVDHDGSSPIVLAIHRDAHGTVWMGATTGLWRMTGDRAVQVPLPPEFPQRPVTVLSSRAGTLWVGDGERLFRWKGKTLTRVDARTADGRESKIRLAHAAADGRLWMASDDGRIAYQDEQGAIHDLGPRQGLPDGTHRAVHAIIDDDEGTVWIAGRGGLTRFANGRASTLTQAQGLPGSRVSSMVVDDLGFLWLSVDRGLARVDRSELTAVLSNPTQRLRYRLYDASDGLAGAPLGTIQSTRASDGMLWFVRGGGLTAVDPHALAADRAQPYSPVHLDSVIANERRFRTASSEALPPGTRRLQISYTALALSTSNNIWFRYRLDGVDAQWVEAGTRRSAFYTNLSPGRYRFTVESHSDDGTWRTSTAAWSFAIQPTFYETNAFYAICAVAAAFVVWGTWRMRLRIAQQRFALVMAERNRLSREVHDTLLQSLVAIALEFDALGRTVDSSAAAAKQNLLRIRRQVEEQIREVRQSIWQLRTSTAEVPDLCEALSAFATKMLADRSVHVSAKTSGTSHPGFVGMDTQLLRIGQEAITNAARHANATSIRIELHFSKDTVTLRISDNGCGFRQQDAPTNLDGHYGLTTMRERAEEVGGRLTLTSTPGHGTIVEAVLPARTGRGR